MGTIEHLEGYDTVGLRSDVQALVESGRVDQALVKDVGEVQAQLAQTGAEPRIAPCYSDVMPFGALTRAGAGAIQLMLERADAC